MATEAHRIKVRWPVICHSCDDKINRGTHIGCTNLCTNKNVHVCVWLSKTNRNVHVTVLNDHHSVLAKGISGGGERERAKNEREEIYMKRVWIHCKCDYCWLNFDPLSWNTYVCSFRKLTLNSFSIIISTSPCPKEKDVWGLHILHNEMKRWCLEKRTRVWRKRSLSVGRAKQR